MILCNSFKIITESFLNKTKFQNFLSVILVHSTHFVIVISFTSRVMVDSGVIFNLYVKEKKKEHKVRITNV